MGGGVRLEGRQTLRAVGNADSLQSIADGLIAMTLTG